jgi:RNA polymerase I-specific transcription initiation factor RRN7
MTVQNLPSRIEVSLMTLQDVQVELMFLQAIAKDLWSLRLQDLRSLVLHDAGTDTEVQLSRRFRSQSEDKNGADTASQRSQARPHDDDVKGPHILELLCIEYVAMILLKTPVTIADFIRWTNSGDLIYYHASREVPLSLREGLSGAHQANLDPQELIDGEHFHDRVLSMVAYFNKRFGMEVPAINHTLILFRWVKDLALPLEVYVATQRLSQITAMHFGYSTDYGSKAKALSYPEVRLAVLMIIVIKMLFPLDATTHYAESRSALSALSIDWEVWNSVSQSDHDPSLKRQIGFERAFSMTEDQSNALDGEALDEYLDWCDENLASEELRRRETNDDAPFRRALFDMFPSSSARRRKDRVESIQTIGTESRYPLEQLQFSLRPERLAADTQDEDAAPFGTSYRQHKSVSELEELALTLYTRVAGLASYPVPDFTMAIFQMETRLEKFSSG